MIDYVVAAKTQLQNENVDTSGVEGAWKITNRAAIIAHAGLLEKASGNNWNGYAVDIVCYPDGHIYDVLIDGGGANTPSWQDKGMVDPSRYRPPVGVVATPPVDPPTPPVDEGGPDILAAVADIQARLQRIEDALKTSPQTKAPNYVGRLFGATIVLRPE